MRSVLGLSLNSDDVAWVLVDAGDGTVLDHDAFDLQHDAEIAGAAARGAHAIARACGFEVDRVRLTWSDDVVDDGLRLRTRLASQGFDHVEAVPMARAMAASVDPRACELAPRSASAYGAARAVVPIGEAITVPVVQQIPPRRRIRRRRIVSTALGVAAAAVLGVLCLSAGAVPQAEPGSAAVVQPGSADAGWAAVPAPSDAAANTVRRVVTTPTPVRRAAAVPAQTYVPEQAYVPEQTSVPEAPVAVAPEAPVAVAPEPATAPVAVAPEPAAEPATVAPGLATEPAAAPTELPHLSDAQHVMGPAPEAPGPVADPPAAPEMTELTNVFTALP